jgi:crossover junction endodeoxyribonuclease RuvC
VRVLGIDPGSDTTGWGVVEGDGRRYRVIEYGTIRTSASEKFCLRLLKISNGIEELIQRHQPDACAIEDGFLKTNVKVTLKLGQVRGIALLAAARAAIDIHEYSPRLVKQTVVGYGNAEKHQVQEMVRVLLSLKSALAVAICHFHHAGLQQRLRAADARVKLATAATRTTATATRRRAV